MLQLQLPLRATFLALTLISILTPTPTLTLTLTHILIRLHIHIHIHIPIRTLTTVHILIRINILKSAPRPHVHTPLSHGIHIRPSPLAGSHHQHHQHSEETSIKGLLHAAPSWKYQFRGFCCCFYSLFFSKYFYNISYYLADRVNMNAGTHSNRKVINVK